MTMATVRGGGVETSAKFASAPDRSFGLTLKEFATDADPRTQTFQVVLEMPQPEGITILPGMTATVSGQAGGGEGATVVVPASAIFANETGTSQVWVVDRESMTVSIREVTTGELTGTEGIEILGGLKPGETIAVTGVTQIRKGDRVRDLAEDGGRSR
jgi:RND family efflux transporter MFP subunit